MVVSIDLTLPGLPRGLRQDACMAPAGNPSEGSVREEGKRHLVQRRRGAAKLHLRQLVTTATVKPNGRLRGCEVEHKMRPLQRALARSGSSMCLFNVYYCNQENPCY